jgi:hypothetical protein
MMCWEAAAERLQTTPCMKDVQTCRHRCSHPLSVRCSAATALKEAWEQHGGVAAVKAVSADPSSVTVEHGTDYGPSETQLAKESGIKAVIPACAVLVR